MDAGKCANEQAGSLRAHLHTDDPPSFRVFPRSSAAATFFTVFAKSPRRPGRGAGRAPAALPLVDDERGLIADG